MATYSKPQLSSDPNNLLQDLFRIADYGNWAGPKYKENIDWLMATLNEEHPELQLASFSLKHHFLPKYLSIFKKRVDLLISEGADIKPLCYQIANINTPEALSYCLDLGADPNISNKHNNLPLVRAIDRKRSTIVKILLNHPSFNFDFHFSTHSANQKTIFSNLFENNFTTMLNIILEKKPELYLAKDSKENSIFHYLNSFDLENLKSTPIKKLFSNSLHYLKENSIYFDIHQPNEYNQIIKNEILLNGLIGVNHYLIDKELPKNNIVNTKPIVKL